MKPPRGGKREGAGRKARLGERLTRVTIGLTEAQIERLKQLGDGNISAGVRVLMEQHPEDEPRSA
jgi:hypothetical protein